MKAWIRILAASSDRHGTSGVLWHYIDQNNAKMRKTNREWPIKTRKKANYGQKLKFTSPCNKSQNRSSSSERTHTSRIKTTPQITLQVNDTFDNYFFSERAVDVSTAESNYQETSETEMRCYLRQLFQLHRLPGKSVRQHLVRCSRTVLCISPKLVQEFYLPEAEAASSCFSNNVVIISNRSQLCYSILHFSYLRTSCTICKTTPTRTMLEIM